MLKLKTTTAFLGTLFLTTAAFGGLTLPQVVTVDPVNMVASGDQVTARYSKNDVELIGCGIRKISDGVGGFIHFAFCQATDAADVSIICFTQDPELVDTISSSADYGFITFSWDADDQCTRMGFSNQSFYLPKGLKANKP